MNIKLSRFVTQVDLTKDWEKRERLRFKADVLLWLHFGCNWSSELHVAHWTNVFFANCSVTVLRTTVRLVALNFLKLGLKI